MIASAQMTIVDLNDPIQQGTAPTNPTEGMLWLNTSESPPQLYRWTGKAWEAINQQDIDIGGTNLAARSKISAYKNIALTCEDYLYTQTFTGASYDSSGLKISEDIFQVGEKYVLTFKTRKTSGTVATIGGHCSSFTTDLYKLDGAIVGKPWNNGVSVGNDTAEHSFEVHFTYLGNGSDKALYIQPNWGSASSGPYTLQIYDLKVETGVIATDWFPAPEDISDQIELQLQNARSQITATADAIRQEVEATYARADDLDKAVQRLSTLAEQTESSFTWTVQQLALLQSDMTGSQQELSDQLAELLTYMTFDSKGLTIGKSGNPVSVLVSNDKLSFLVNGGTVAYFSDNKLYVQNGEFLGSLRLGRFAFVPQSNGNLSLTLVS